MNKRKFGLIIFSLVFSLFFLTFSFAANIPQVMFILDGSGSMWGDAGGQTKIEAARGVMSKVVPSLPPEVKTGLTAYGHRKKGDCNDIEVLLPIGSAGREDLLAKVNAIKPKGKTPIAASLKKAVDTIKQSENETTIVLVSDGEETCHDDTCGVVKEMKSLGINFILHVVGFGVTAKEKKSLECLAQAGGGQYFGAADADALLKAFEDIKTEVVQKVEKAKATTVKAKTRLGKLRITLPQTGLKSLASIKLIRKSDGKIIKTVERPEADSTHPLLAGEYEVILGFANVNYRDPSEASIGTFEVKGGETKEAELGSIGLNVAPSFTKKGAIWSISVISKGMDKPLVTITAFDGNDYYLYKPKTVTPGTYDLAFHYSESPKPTVVAQDIKVEKGKEATVTLDSGISLKKPAQQQGITGWDLVPSGTKDALLMVKKRFDNEYPLWQNFVVPPGTYDLYLHLGGMDEPLLVGEGIEIIRGQLVDFDSGL